MSVNQYYGTLLIGSWKCQLQSCDLQLCQARVRVVRQTCSSSSIHVHVCFFFIELQTYTHAWFLGYVGVHACGCMVRD